MNSRKLIFTAFLFAAIVSACKSTKEVSTDLQLDSKYNQIKSIKTSANCEFPEGSYITNVTSHEDGSASIFQQLEGKKPFNATLLSNGIGVTLDDNNYIKDTLPEKGVVMFRYHEFHKMHTSPDLFFNQITFDKEENGYMLFSATDKLKNPVTIYYDKANGLISKFSLVHPMDNRQSIEIFNDSWSDTEFGKMVKQVSVVQAAKDTFKFDFVSIEINP